MMKFDAVIALWPDLGAVELSGWIDCRWVQPETTGDDWLFDEIDVARVRLIYDLRRRLDVTEDVLPIVLSLLDQVYELRNALTTMTRAIGISPPDVQAAVLSALATVKGT
ncbi:chaperone modulator CbpM [Telmatospirillum sp.]|uniref:chaperone modulator CbpM n=1 Tax=Telmatospirillum sp. TaxID=2079197 RepID=UPI00284BA4CA|nr:chaperone modulator CbpM [Telmatospirillum sp.]MDR3436948.1 chaperone modulator CbpM [Telmatospirillum sp.]